MLFRPNKGRPPRFSAVVYLDCVCDWDITTLFHAPQTHDLRKSTLLHDRLCCMCYHPKPGWFSLFKKILQFSHWLQSNSLHPCRATGHLHVKRWMDTDRLRLVCEGGELLTWRASSFHSCWFDKKWKTKFLLQKAKLAV